MGAIPLTHADYRRFDGSPMRLLNCFYERAPENIEDQVSIQQRPGLTIFATVGSSAVRGIGRQAGSVSGKAILVAGTTAYAVTTAAAVTTITGGSVTGSGYVSVGFNDDYAWLANGTAFYRTAGATLATVSVPDGAGVSSCAGLIGYILLSLANTQTVYWVRPGATTINALDFVSAESNSSFVRRIETIRDEAWIFCDDKIEVWLPSGDAEAPFMRNDGRIFGIGIAATSAACKVADAICFIGGEDRKVYRIAEGPVRISDHSLEEKLRKADPTTFRMWGWTVDGHDVLVITYGTGVAAIDLETGLPFALASYGKSRFRAHLGCSMGDAKFIGADAFDGKLWLVDATASNDNGDPLEREFTGVLELTGAPERCNSVALEGLVGQGGAYPADDPKIGLQWSDDGGRTWSEMRFAYLGREGQFRQQVIWKKLGPMRKPGRIFRWRLTDNVPMIARKAKFNESLI